MNTIFCANRNSRSISVIDGVDDQVIAAIPLGGSPLKLDLDTDSNRVYCLTGGPGVVTIDAQSNRVVDSIFLGEGLSAMCFARQTRCVLVADGDLSAVAVIVGDSNRLRGWTRLGIEPDMLLADQSGTKLYAFGGVYPYDSVNVSAIDPQRCVVTKCFELQSDGHPSAGCYDSADGKVYHVGFGPNVGVIDAESDSVLGYVSMPDDVYGLTYAPAVDKVYVGGGYFDGFIAAIDGRGDSLVTSLSIPDGGGVYGICYDPTHGTVYGFGNQRAVFTVVDCLADTIVGQFAGGRCCGGSLYNPISDKVYTVDYVGGAMLVIDAATYSILAQVDIGNGAGEVTLNTTNNKVYSTGLYALGIVDGAGDSLIARMAFSYYHRYLAYDPDHNILYFDHDSGDVNAVSLVDGATDSVVGNILLGGYLSDMISVPQAGRVFVADIDNSCLYVIRTSPPAVADGPSAGVHRVGREATVVRGVLVLGAASGRQNAECGAALLDAVGRKVLNLRPGANDVRALAPGVYFVRQASSVMRQAPSVTKVVLQH